MGKRLFLSFQGLGFYSRTENTSLTHTAKELPRQFESSLGVLENCEPVKDVMIAFRNVEEMISKAEEHVWILTNQILASTIPYLLSALERGAEFHLTMQKDYNPPKSIHDLVSNPTFTKAARNRKMDFRFLDKVPVFMCLSEKEVAALAFPDMT